MGAIIKRTTCYQAIFRNARFSDSMLQRWQWVMSMPTRLLLEHSWLCSLRETCIPIWCIIPLTRKGLFFPNIPWFLSPTLIQQIYVRDPIFRQRGLDECHHWSYIGSNTWYCSVCFPVLVFTSFGFTVLFLQWLSDQRRTTGKNIRSSRCDRRHRYAQT